MCKIWLITGSSSGLGRSILEAALKAGNKVLATARKPERLDGLVAQYAQQVRTFELDVTDAHASQAAVDLVVETYGRLDVLVNNAGYGHIVPFEQTDDASFRAQMDTNFYGVVNLVRAALPHMRKRRQGQIINISSVGGRTSAPGLSAYQAAKWAVGGFTEVLCKETAAFGVNAIAIEPGGMRTDWSAVASGQQIELFDEYQPSVGAMLTRLKDYSGTEVGDPRKVADVIVDLASQQNLPPHLLLGSDALRVYETAEGERRRAADEWRAVTTSVDVEGV